MRRAVVTPLLAALLATATLLAGCVQSDAPAGTAEEASADLAGNATPANATETFLLDGEITLAAGAAGAYAAPTVLLDDSRLEVRIGPNATAILVELTWGNKLNDLDITIDEEAGGDPRTLSGGSHGQGDSPMRVVIPGDEIEKGYYIFTVWAKNSVAEKFHLAVTVFYEGVPADDFTALA